MLDERNDVGRGHGEQEGLHDEVFDVLRFIRKLRLEVGILFNDVRISPRGFQLDGRDG